MTEFRFLDQKRQAEGLTADEAARYAQLRDLVGPETAGPTRSGFDVNAAAARLRESLLPAGLRHRPAEAAPPPPPEPEQAAPPPEALALEQAWAEAPFAELSPEAVDPLFDPGSMAQEVRPQAWNPEAPGYDPDAPYDEAAWIAAGYDPSATYDWSAYGYGPDGQPLPAEGSAPDAPAEAFADAPPEQPLEVAEPPLEAEAPATEAPPAEAAWEAAPIEAAPEAWGAPDDLAPAEPAAEAVPEQPWDTAFAEQSAELQPDAGLEQAWGAPAADAGSEVATDAAPALAEEAPHAVEPSAAPAEEPEELPFDPHAPFDHAKWFGRPTVEGAAPEAPAPGELAPGVAPDLTQVEPEVSFELAPEPEAAAPAFGEYDEAAAPLATSAPHLLEDVPAAPGEPSAGELALAGADPGLAPLEAEASAGWLGDAAPAGYEPAPAGAPFGEYDEAAAPLAGAPAVEGALEAMLPFDPAEASAIEAGALPEGYEPGGPALDPAALPPVSAGGYDEAAAFSPDQMYGGPEGDSLPGGAPLELGAALPDWQPDAALEQGFELASDGSFGQGGSPFARTPAWGTAVPATPAEGWESTPALDLAGSFELPAEATAPEAAPLAPLAAEELPTIDGAELLEELPPEAAASALEVAPTEAPLSAEPGRSAFDGAYEEAAAFPPPALDDPLAALPVDGVPVEPEPAVSYEAAPMEVPPEIAAAYAAGAGVASAPLGGLDPFAAPAEAARASASADTFELPPAMAAELFEPAPEPEVLEAEPLPPAPTAVEVPGTHRVVLHTVDGQVKRGLLVDALLDAPALALQPQVAGAPEEIPTEGIKAIFFMLSPGEKAPSPEGKKVRVTFRDGRQVAGFSPDYQEGLVGFFMIPADTRTNTGRIWVYQSAVKTVAIS